MNPIRPNHRLRTIALLAALCAAVVVTGCGERSETPAKSDLKQNRVVLTLDWQPNANHAGLYTGIENGAFADQGIRVDPKIPSDPAAVIKQVAAGRTDLGISYQNEVMEARDAGAKVRAIAAIVPTPLNSLIWLKKSKIKRISDLKGKTVATSGAYGSTFLNVMLDNAGLTPTDVKQVNVGYDLLPALLGGKADAIIGAYWNVEGVQLELKDRPATVIPVDRGGVPKYDELVVIASEENLKDSGRVEIYRRFLAGLRDGTAAAVADPKLAEAALIDNFSDLKKNRAELELSLKKTLPVLKAPQNHPFGYMSPDVWVDFGNFMRDQGLLKQAPNSLSAFTNDVLPGQGPKKEAEPDDRNAGGLRVR